MRAQTACTEDESLVEASEALAQVEELGGVWMRLCPLCHAVLCKSSPDAPLRCVCGWDWRV